MLKKLIRKLCIGIAMGCSILTFQLLITKTLGFTQAFDFMTEDFTRQALCAMAVAIPFNVLALVYDNKRLAFGFQVLIHMGVGLLIYFPIALYAGWIPLTAGIGTILSVCLFILIFSFLIWFGYYLYYYYEAKKINRQIKLANQKHK